MNYLVTVREAAWRLGHREGTIRLWLRQGRLPRVKLGRSVRIPSDAIDRLIADSLRPAAKETRG